MNLLFSHELSPHTRTQILASHFLFKLFCLPFEGAIFNPLSSGRSDTFLCAVSLLVDIFALNKTNVNSHAPFDKYSLTSIERKAQRL